MCAMGFGGYNCLLFSQESMDQLGIKLAFEDTCDIVLCPLGINENVFGAIDTI